MVRAKQIEFNSNISQKLEKKHLEDDAADESNIEFRRLRHVPFKTTKCVFE